MKDEYEENIKETIRSLKIKIESIDEKLDDPVLLSRFIPYVEGSVAHLRYKRLTLLKVWLLVMIDFTIVTHSGILTSGPLFYAGLASLVVSAGLWMVKNPLFMSDEQVRKNIMNKKENEK